MNIVLVDNNAGELSQLSNKLAMLFPECEIQLFSDPLMSAKYICNNEVNLVFLATDMRPVDGFVLLRTLRANKPQLHVVMMASSEMGRSAAFSATTEGYLVKPISTKLLGGIIKQIYLDEVC